MKGLSKQLGASFLSVSLMVIVGGFFALLGMRLIPVYYEHYTIVHALDTLKSKYVSSEDRVPATRRNIMKSLQRILSVNEVSRLKSNNIRIVWQNHDYTVSIDYNVQVKMAGNISALVDFSDGVVIPNATR